MVYHGKFRHTLGRVQHIDLMSIIDIFYTDYRLDTQNVLLTILGLQGIKRFVQYLDSHPHKLVFYPFNYYDGSNIIRLTWSGN